MEQKYIRLKAKLLFLFSFISVAIFSQTYIPTPFKNLPLVTTVDTTLDRLILLHWNGSKFVDNIIRPSTILRKAGGSGDSIDGTPDFIPLFDRAHHISDSYLSQDGTHLFLANKTFADALTGNSRLSFGVGTSTYHEWYDGLNRSQFYADSGQVRLNFSNAFGHHGLVQLNHANTYLQHDVLLKFDAPVINIPQATSAIPVINNSKNLDTLIVGIGLAYNHSTRTLTSTAITDTTSLSNRINAKLAKTDTSTLSARINLKANYTDTLKFMHKLYSVTETVTGNKTFSGSNAYGTPASITLTNGTGYTGANLSMSDVTTNNVSISQHGFAPKAPNDNTRFLNGTGAWSVPTFSNATYGNIITESFSNLTNFTQTGSAFTATGGVCNISSAPGSISFASYIRQTAYGTSDLESTTISADLTVGTINSTSFGVGFGYYSQGAISPVSLTVAFLMDNTNKGHIAFYFNNATTNGVLSASKITIATGDVTSIKIRQIKDTYIATWTNGTQVMTATYTYFMDNTVNNPTAAYTIPNTVNYTIYALGGSTHVVDNFLVNNDENKSPDILFIGDSETKGYNNGNFQRRATELISANTTYRTAVIANAGEKIEEINAQEVLNLTPTQIVISIGSNNIFAGDSPTTVMTKLATLVSSFTSAGYVLGSTLFVTTIRPRVSNDMTTVNASIRSTYSTSFIELYYPFWSGTSFTMNAAYANIDGVHLNEFGAQLEAGIYINYFNIKMNAAFNFSNRNISENMSGDVGVGVANTSARYPLDAYSTTKSQIHFSQKYSGTTNAGGYLLSFSDNSAAMFGGASWDASTWTARSTAYGGVTTVSGDLFFYGATGASVGASITPANIATIVAANGGKMFIGGSTTPTARLHLAAGSATANTAPIQLTSGPVETTARAGVVEYDGTHFFVSPASATRYQVSQVLIGSATLDFASTSAQSSSDLTITVTGASAGDVVSVGANNGSVLSNSDYTCWVSASNTVTVRFNNYSSGSQDPASGTFKVVVNKN